MNIFSHCYLIFPVDTVEVESEEFHEEISQAISEEHQNIQGNGQNIEVGNDIHNNQAFTQKITEKRNNFDLYCNAVPISNESGPLFIADSSGPIILSSSGDSFTLRNGSNSIAFPNTNGPIFLKNSNGSLPFSELKPQVFVLCLAQIDYGFAEQLYDTLSTDEPVSVSSTPNGLYRGVPSTTLYQHLDPSTSFQRNKKLRQVPIQKKTRTKKPVHLQSSSCDGCQSIVKPSESIVLVNCRHNFCR